MPVRARRICRDCSRLAVAGSSYCELHEENNLSLRADRDRHRFGRDSGFKKLYDSRHWRKLTVPLVLLEEPLCRIGVLCGGRAPSTDVDHIIRAELYIAMQGGDPIRFFDRENLRGACHADHSRKTAMENAGTWEEPKAS